MAAWSVSQPGGNGYTCASGWCAGTWDAAIRAPANMRPGILTTRSSSDAEHRARGAVGRVLRGGSDGGAGARLRPTVAVCYADLSSKGDFMADEVVAESIVPAVKITVRPNGPFRVEGPISLVDANGVAWDLTGKPAVSLCRCGLSSNRPFCDGTHGREGWKCDASPALKAE